MKLAPDYKDPNLGVNLPSLLNGRNINGLKDMFGAYKVALNVAGVADDCANEAMRSCSHEILQVAAGTRRNPVLTVGRHKMVKYRGQPPHNELVSGIEFAGEEINPNFLQFQGAWTFDKDGKILLGRGVEVVDGGIGDLPRTFIKIGTFVVGDEFAELSDGFRFALPMEGAVPGKDALFGGLSVKVPANTELKILKRGTVIHSTTLLI